jgi:hypothetical protein
MQDRIDRLDAQKPRLLVWQGINAVLHFSPIIEPINHSRGLRLDHRLLTK